MKWQRRFNTDEKNNYQMQFFPPQILDQRGELKSSKTM